MTASSGGEKGSAMHKITTEGAIRGPDPRQRTGRQYALSRADIMNRRCVAPRAGCRREVPADDREPGTGNDSALKRGSVDDAFLRADNRHAGQTSVICKILR